MANHDTLKKFISKTFTHYRRLTGLKRKVSFKNLRKIYLTWLTSVIGEKQCLLNTNEDENSGQALSKEKELLKQTMCGCTAFFVVS
jgi:hypothetical protein